jgi:LSD1 subclass zinc finger protein
METSMPEYSPKTLTCPSCGAPLEFDGSSSLVKCKFCKTTAVIPGVQAQQVAVTPAALEEIRGLAQRGNLLEAIRRYRELANVGLKEASDAVDMLASGHVVEAHTVFTGPLSAEETGRILEEVQDLLRSENKIEAIRRYREATDVSMVKAREVVERVEATLKGLPVPTTPEISGTPASYQPQAAGKRRSSLGAMIAVFIVVLIGGFLALIFFMAGGPFNSMLVANGPVILSAPGDGDQDLAAAFYNGTDETYQVGMLDKDTGKLRWLADPLPGNNYVDAITQAEGLVFVASRVNLLAYGVDDGSLVWQAVMPDGLNYSDISMLVAGERDRSRRMILAPGGWFGIDAWKGTTAACAWWVVH